jgi:phosphoglycolate phosphatase-like HAD superfamily hydrolase
MSVNKPKLVLVDIDGTLISPGMTPRQCLTQAIWDLTGKTIEFQVGQLAGNTDPLIVTNALKQLGIPYSDQDGLVGKIIWNYLKLLLQRFPEAKDKSVFPGARQLLEYLQSQSVRLGIITGNVMLGAYCKLRAFGLWDYFSFGVFGDDSYDRNNLPRIALMRVNELFGESYRPHEVVIIGDTMNDVRCAKINGMYSVVVLRREEWRADIEENKPDLLITSLEPLTPFTRWFEKL